MQAIIKPGFLKGDISVPASKSIMQRVCAAALLHNGETIINNPGSSEDDKVALQIIQQLGAKITKQTSEQIIIESSGRVNAIKDINCNESGLSARLFTPIAALCGDEVLIEGKGSLLQRPMDAFKEVLPQLNVSLKAFNGFIPFSVKGPLQGKSITVDGSISSQFLTGVLFALTSVAKEPIVVTVKGLKSKPYIDLTLKVLAQFGRQITNENYCRFIIDPAQFTIKDEVTIQIEADWSSAAYWLVGAAINGSIRALHLDQHSLQADKKIIEILERAGCVIQFERDMVCVKKADLRAFNADLTDAPDLFPIVAILAACCTGTSRLQGLHRLKYKESDRKKSIADMLAGFGVSVSIENDSLLIEGRQQLNPATINGYNDHRIVMAAAIGALLANGETSIAGKEAVGKSYPLFFQHLSLLHRP
ncbi:MAG TPA: 3-phosphoshikimate 1-carboxyvinyltransferase [Flavipsychrobacter sp.]|jgi:3-phosphoshikimate 1-carboxyvinyltransferase|nr:3-phosphoshikimate 1-carboxyvinyltransferase [Flavipsychrobacter sp.]